MSEMSPMQLAMQEFAAFKKGKSVSVPVTEHATPARSHQYADKMLYCATHGGLASQMILKLSSGVAEIIEVRKLAHARVSARNEAVSDDQEILRTHTLDPGRFQECPHCRSNSVVRCSACETLSCIGPYENRHHCPCCGRIAGTRTAEIRIGIEQENERMMSKARVAEKSQAQLSHSSQSGAGKIGIPLLGGKKLAARHKS